MIFSGEMTWREAVTLAKQLSQDPSSAVFAAVNGWDYPLSREAMALNDLFDLQARAHFKHPKPYPRPTDKKRSRSKAPVVSQARIREALAARGHGRKRIAGEQKKPN